jgi:hypothetical protein
MSDSLFYCVDRNCEPARFRGTGWIEPAKFKWYQVTAQDQSPEEVVIRALLQLLCHHILMIAIQVDDLMDIGSLQDWFSISAPSYRMVAIDGCTSPVVDISGWLQMNVFVVQSDPERGWNVSNVHVHCYELRRRLDAFG